MTDRKRSAISGQFVTAEYADTHPDTTVSESRPARAEEQTHAIEALVDEVRRTGCAVEIAGVRIAPCDERGQTADTRALAHMAEARDNARAESERLAGLVEAVRALHQPAGRHNFCGTCAYATWPCATYRALDGEETR